MADKMEIFLKEFEELQNKYGIFVEAGYEEQIDYDWDENPYVSGIESHLVLYDKNGNKFGMIDWDNEFIEEKDPHS